MEDRINKLDRLIVEDTSLGPALFEELQAAQRKLGLLQGDRATCPFLRPYILPRHQYDNVRRAAETLAAVFEKVAIAALADQSLLAFLGLTPAEEEAARIEPGYSRLCVSSRLDGHLNTSGFQFLEYNAETPAGVGDQMQLENILFRLTALKDFLETNSHWLPQPHVALLKSLLTAYREWGGQEDKPQIAIIDWEGVPTSSEFRILKDYFVAQGYPVLIADPHDLEYNGDYLTAEGFRIDIVYKRVVIHEFLNEFGLDHPLIHAYWQGRVCMANSFRTKLAHKKSTFAVLRNPAYAHLFDSAELEVIQKHIPWTCYVRPSRTVFHGSEFDLETLILKEREQFVLKPNDDYGGHGVFLGWESSGQEWQEAVKAAFRRPYVVQERVVLEKTNIPAYSDRVYLDELFVDFNPFLFQNEVEGALIRLSASSLLNVTSGGGQTALLVLEE
ncbi:MAG TPA: circularly permuted type 2 ATP-grasp protein [Pyrinomonadaceae bacterium]